MPVEDVKLQKLSEQFREYDGRNSESVVSYCLEKILFADERKDIKVLCKISYVIWKRNMEFKRN